MPPERNILLEHAAHIGEIRAELRGLREQQKSHAEDMQRDILIFSVKIDSILEYINTQKGQKITIVAIASVVAMFGTKVVGWIAEKLS